MYYVKVCVCILCYVSFLPFCHSATLHLVTFLMICCCCSIFFYFIIFFLGGGGFLFAIRILSLLLMSVFIFMTLHGVGIIDSAALHE